MLWKVVNFPAPSMILGEFPLYFWSPFRCESSHFWWVFTGVSPNQQVQRVVHGMDPMDRRNWHLPWCKGVVNIAWVVPPPRLPVTTQDYEPFLGSGIPTKTFICHYYWEGGQPNIAPKNGWLEYDPFLLGFCLFSGRTVSFREGTLFCLLGLLLLLCRYCTLNSPLLNSYCFHVFLFCCLVFVVVVVVVVVVLLLLLLLLLVAVVKDDLFGF